MGFDVMYISDVDYEEMICEIEFRSYSYAMITNEQVRNHFEIYFYDFHYSGPPLEVDLKKLIEILEKVGKELVSTNTEPMYIVPEKIVFNYITSKRSITNSAMIELIFESRVIGTIWIADNGITYFSAEKEINKFGDIRFDLVVFIEKLKEAQLYLSKI